jgi:hypothetical protein
MNDKLIKIVRRAAERHYAFYNDEELKRKRIEEHIPIILPFFEEAYAEGQKDIIIRNRDNAIRALGYVPAPPMENFPSHCSQCGKSFTEEACGPTHAVIAAQMAQISKMVEDDEKEKS